MILILQQLVGDARLIWEKMRDYNEKKLVMTHDGYLKLYQLSRPALTRYHCILIDEAQDLTPGKMVPALTRYHCILIDEAQDLTSGKMVPALTRYHCILIDEAQDLTPGKVGPHTLPLYPD